jgi:hypothetical protein
MGPRLNCEENFPGEFMSTHRDLKWASYDAAFEDLIGSDLDIPELTSAPVQAQIDAGHRQLDAGDQDGA